MQYFTGDFNPQEYDGIEDIRGNGRVTLMVHCETGQKIVRKEIGAANSELFMQLAQISHENLVRIFGLEEKQACWYTYEEYIDGKPLTEVIAGGPVPEEEAVRWIGQLCSAVGALHGNSPVLIHRDIKPGNVMLASDGSIKLIDFDASKEFSPGKQRDTELIGTPNYAAPEQYGFAASDPRTDIYAIGVLFHELVTGHRPNESSLPYRGRCRHVIQSCIELDPKRRYRSIRELERQLGMRGIRRLIWNIPGFRTGVWWKKAAAIVIYTAAALSAVSTVYEDPTLLLTACLAAFLVPLFLLAANPLRFREKLPLLKSRSMPVKITGYMLYVILWALLFASLTINYAARK